MTAPVRRDGPTSSGANSGQTEVVDLNLKGPWTDETDIQPTEMYLLGLHTDYIQDGRVITQILSSPNGALRSPLLTQLGEEYKQLNASVGQFGAYTLTASTKAIESSTPGDAEFTDVNRALTALDQQRDALANVIKTELYNAENRGTPVPSPACSSSWRSSSSPRRRRSRPTARQHVPHAPGDVRRQARTSPGARSRFTAGRAPG